MNKLAEAYALGRAVGLMKAGAFDWKTLLTQIGSMGGTLATPHISKAVQKLPLQKYKDVATAASKYTRSGKPVDYEALAGATQGLKPWEVPLTVKPVRAMLEALARGR
jgi:hypothetical protein